MALILQLLIAVCLAACSRHEHANREKPVVTMVTDPPRNFGRSIFVQGKVLIDGEAPLFVSSDLHAAYWVVDEPPELMSKLRATWRPDHISCIDIRRQGSVSSNLISRHAFINHHGIKFERLEVRDVNPQCALSPEELKLTDTEL